MRYLLLFSLMSSLMAFGCDDSSEGGSVPFGEPCNSPSDCASGLTCIASGSAQLCSQNCDLANAMSCPDGYECVAAGSVAVCSPSAMTAGTMAAGTMTAGTTTAGTDTAGTMTAGTMAAGTDTAGTMMAMTGACDPAFIECVNACQDQNCQQNCFNNTDTTTQNLYNGFQGCLRSSTTNCPQGDVACILNSCETEYTACYEVGNLSCSEVNSCFAMCGETDRACISECQSNSNFDAIVQITAISLCFDNAVQSGTCAEADTQCVNQACQAEVSACLGGGGPGGGPGGSPAIPAPTRGSLSCGAAYSCAGIRCQPSDMACQQECLAGVSAQEEAALQAFLTCSSTAMCRDFACIEANCGAEYSACFPGGDLSCGDFLTCASNCGQDIYCAIECELDVSAAGQMPLQALGQCAQMNMCTSYDNCPQCANEYAACSN